MLKLLTAIALGVGVMTTPPQQIVTPPTIEEIIREEAILQDVDPNLMVRVAFCESNLDPKALNINKNGTKDFGIFQINTYYNPEVTEECAYNALCASKWAVGEVKKGKLWKWSASSKCWLKTKTTP